MWYNGFRIRKGVFLFDLPARTQPEDALFVFSSGEVLTPTAYEARVVDTGIEVSVKRPNIGLVDLLAFVDSAARRRPPKPPG